MILWSQNNLFCSLNLEIILHTLKNFLSNWPAMTGFFFQKSEFIILSEPDKDSVTKQAGDFIMSQQDSVFL